MTTDTPAAPIPSSGVLYVVATPIGNLEDITLRAIRILGEVDLIASEDTRRTKKLLSHLGLSTPLISYFREKERTRAGQLLNRLKQGQSIALVTDAGTPAISDPGAVLVNQAHAENIPVIPVPGASAVTAALSVAGLDSTAFFFAGFPPAKKKARQTFFQNLCTLRCPVVLYESPHRIHHCLKDAHAILGNRQAQIFREITKIHEERLAGPLSSLTRQLDCRTARGEYVLIIEGSSGTGQATMEDADALLINLRDQTELSLRDAVAQVASRLRLPRSRIYKRALTLWAEQENNTP